jgi:hypothetical protein
MHSKNAQAVVLWDADARPMVCTPSTFGTWSPGHTLRRIKDPVAFYDNLTLKSSGRSLILPGADAGTDFQMSGLKFRATRINLQGQACKKLHGPCASNHKSSTGIRHGSTEVCAASTCNVQEGLSAVAFGVIDDSNFVARASVNLNPLSRHLSCKRASREIRQQMNWTFQFYAQRLLLLFLLSVHDVVVRPSA